MTQHRERSEPASLLLAGVRVLDLADASGLVCGRVLADLGADVVKVEPPGGEPARLAEPPFADDRVAPDTSLTWLAANVNKRSLAADLQTPDGQAVVRRLARGADVVVESFAPGRLEALGLGYDALATDNPGLVLTRITPFGQTGPAAGDPASDLEVWAASGSLWLAGEPDGPPVRSTLPQSPHWAGMYAAMGTVLALLARPANGGRGQVVDTSAQASMVTAISHAPAFWDLLGEEQRRSGQFLTGRSVTGANFRNLWPCRDGYVTFALYGGPAGRHTSQQLVAWMEERGGAPEVLKQVDWQAFDVATATPATVEALEAAIAPFIRSVTKAEFAETVVRRNMLGYVVATPEDIRRDEQLIARDFWQQVPTPWDDAPVHFPGGFVLVDGERLPIRRTAPRPGEHTAEVLREWLGEEPATSAPTGSRVA